MLEQPISRAGWTQVRFDQMATQVNDRVDNPAEAGVEFYVGLEHLDPDSLRIRRWGEPTDVESMKLRFRPGDIIFGKRRVYQRKVAVAAFEGICSAHAMVLRAKPGPVLPEFLPFFMQSDLFMERALSISVGSLSPTINWKALAAEEFMLPPIQEQARLVETLIAAEGNLNAYREVQSSLASLIESTVSAFVARWSEKHEFGRFIIDTSYGTSKKSNSDGDGFPVLGIPNVLRDELYLDEFNRVGLTPSEVKKLALRDGDILVVRTNGNPLYVGRSVLIEDLGDVFAYASYLIRIRVNQSKISPAYAACVFGSSQTRQALRRLAKSSAGNYNLNTKDIRSIKLPVPSLDDQNDLVAQVSNLRRTSKELNKRLEVAFKLKRNILEGVAS